MNSVTNQPSCSVYSFHPDVNFNQLSDAMNACLAKAEALSVTASSIDFEAFTAEIINNYLLTLSDVIREARFLYKKLALIN